MSSSKPVDRVSEREKGKGAGKIAVLALLLGFVTLFYYFGEFIDLFGWEGLRLSFFYGVHDIQRLLFILPIAYAGYIGGVKGAVIISLVTILILLPRAFFISPFPDPVLRPVLFVVIAGGLGIFIAIARRAR